jgi:putative SOS response-associated peptidase YedK
LIVNGRIEELTSKRTFTKNIERRCVVIMEGYYEWKSKEEPFCFRPKTADHVLVAGLYTPDNEVVILTRDASPQVAAVHDRMPVVLSPGEVELWLDPKNTRDINIIIHRCLNNKDKCLWKGIGCAKIAPYVNKKEEKGVRCLMTAEEYRKELDKKGLMRFWKKEPVEVVGKEGEVLKEKN